jgi:hypothetical protein
LNAVKGRRIRGTLSNKKKKEGLSGTQTIILTSISYLCGGGLASLTVFWPPFLELWQETGKETSERQ